MDKRSPVANTEAVSVGQFGYHKPVLITQSQVYSDTKMLGSGCAALRLIVLDAAMPGVDRERLVYKEAKRL